MDGTHLWELPNAAVIKIPMPYTWEQSINKRLRIVVVVGYLVYEPTAKPRADMVGTETPIGKI